MKNTNKSTVRKLLLAFLIVIAYIIQCTLLPHYSDTVPVMLLIPAAFTAAMFEKELTGMLLGLLAGALWDTASALPDGSLALISALLCLTVSLMTRYVMRNTLLTALLINGIACAVISLLEIILSPSVTPSFVQSIIITKYLPGFALTLICTVPIYFTVRQLTKMLHRAE